MNLRMIIKKILKYCVLPAVSLIVKIYAKVQKKTLILFAFSGLGDMCYSFAFLDFLKETWGGVQNCRFYKILFGSVSFSL